MCKLILQNFLEEKSITQLSSLESQEWERSPAAGNYAHVAVFSSKNDEQCRRRAIADRSSFPLRIGWRRSLLMISFPLACLFVLSSWLGLSDRSSGFLA
ncbi:hypothetical protein KBT16_22805 [Nostoc sp. CCCryo 231-06]|nr:hypothetical protein [Nostoc sp. CCCryo 231-06]